jgi:mannose-6-phosphate isomerase-like protein (cupin superfamily)
MPLIRSGDGKAPAWCELDDFELVEMKAGDRRSFPRRGEREIYVVCRGLPVLTCGDYEAKPGEGGYFHLPAQRADRTDIWAWHYDALIVRMVGHWKAMATAGTAVFRTVADPKPAGMPYDADKTSSLDRHYHDYQEYWVLYDGSGRMAVGEEILDAKTGDCVVAAAGWHHDCVRVEDGELRIVWLGATPKGRKRIGHLYEQEYGKAVPEVPPPRSV